MKRINIRESLLNMDRETDCKYDLTSLYESVKLDDEKKKQLCQYIDKVDIDATNRFLSNEASSQGLMENASDDISDDQLQEWYDKDPVLAEYDSYDDWWADTSKSLELIESLNESTLTVNDFINDLENTYNEDVVETGDEDYDCDSRSDNYEAHIEVLKDIASQYDAEFDNLTHTICSKIDDMVSKDFTYKQIIDELINDAKSESLNESSEETVKDYVGTKIYRVARKYGFKDNFKLMDEINNDPEFVELCAKYKDILWSAPSAVEKIVSKYLPIEESLNENVQDRIKQWARDDYEAGHPVEDYNEFAKYCNDEGIEPSENLWQVYLDNYESTKEDLKESLTESIRSLNMDGELQLIQSNVVPGIESYKAKYVSGELEGKTFVFVVSDAKGCEYVESKGFNPEDFSTDALEINGEDNNYFIFMPQELGESLNESWTDAYEQFNAAVDKHFPDSVAIELAVEELYNQHKGEADWEEAWRRWNEYNDLIEEDVNEDEVTTVTFTFDPKEWAGGNQNLDDNFGYHEDELRAVPLWFTPGSDEPVTVELTGSLRYINDFKSKYSNLFESVTEEEDLMSWFNDANNDVIDAGWTTSGEVVVILNNNAPDIEEAASDLTRCIQNNNYHVIDWNVNGNNVFVFEVIHNDDYNNLTNDTDYFRPTNESLSKQTLDEGWFSDDDFEDDMMHTDIYGGDPMYCRRCGGKLDYSDGYGFCPDCDGVPEGLYEDIETYWQDVSGGFGETDEIYTFTEIKDYWKDNYLQDPSLSEYDSFNLWWDDTKRFMKQVPQPGLNEGTGEIDLIDALDIDTARFYVYDSEDNVVSDEFEWFNDAIDFADENNYPVVKVHRYVRDFSNADWYVGDEDGGRIYHGEDAAYKAFTELSETNEDTIMEPVEGEEGKLQPDGDPVVVYKDGQVIKKTYTSEALDEDLQGDLDKRYRPSSTNASIERNLEKLLSSDSVKNLELVTMYDNEVTKLTSSDGRIFYLVPSTLSQFDVYDEQENLIATNLFTLEIPNELLETGEPNYIYQVVGGDYAGTYSREELEALPCFSGQYTKEYRTVRSELANQPILDGYLSPMFNGWRENHTACIRYETQKVYDMLSEDGKNLSSKKGTLGNLIASNLELINTFKTKEDIINWLIDIEPQCTNKKYLNKEVKPKMIRCRTFVDAYSYLYSIMLAGEGLRSIENEFNGRRKFAYESLDTNAKDGQCTLPRDGGNPGEECKEYRDWEKNNSLTESSDENWAVFATDVESGKEYCAGVYEDRHYAGYWATQDRIADREYNYGNFKYRVEQVPEYTAELDASRKELDSLKISNHQASQEELRTAFDECFTSEQVTEAIAPDGYEPKKKGTAYKVFKVKNGKLYPPMVANPGGADTPVGVWLTADEGEFAGLSKTGRPQVKSTGSGTLSYRPGWHLGDIPRASQFDRTNKETGEKEFPKDFVWAECEYTMDIDYQPESDEQGYMRIGKDGKQYRSDKYQHSLAGLPKLPKDGYYKYRTNPRPDTVPWVITGAIKVNRLLSDAEVNDILVSKGIDPIHRQGGDKTLAELGL